MIYRDILNTAISEAKQKIQTLQDIRAIPAIQEYMEAYAELYEGEGVDIEAGAADVRLFHRKLLIFLNEITRKHRGKSLGELQRQNNASVFGGAYALLGKCHEKGWLGADQKLDLAIEYYTRSAACKSPMGTFELAGCFEVGKGTERDLERACILYRVSYKLGYIRGLHKYARILLKGNNYVGRNVLDGHYILKQAVLLKDKVYIAPYYDLGMLYKSDVCDIFNDNRYAFDIFLLGAMRGCKYCQYKLGEEYEKGEVVGENMEKAFYWYSLSAKNNLADGQLKMAELLYGIKPNHKDISKAIAQERYMDAQVMFCNSKRYENKCGLTSLELGVLKKRPLISFKGFYGPGFDRFVEGYRMAQLSAAHGKKEAILLVAEALEKGFGTEKSLLESLWWYKIAEGLGCENIREKIYLLEMRLGRKVF